MKKITGWFKRLYLWYRSKRVLKYCGNICYCPKCNDILNDQALWTYDNKNSEKGEYYCNNCQNTSIWFFGAPVPICLIHNANAKEDEND